MAAVRMLPAVARERDRWGPSGHSRPGRVPARGRSARLDGELKLQELRNTPAVDVDVRHLPVRRLAVVRLDILQAHRNRVRGGVPAGYGTWLGPVDVQLAARPCSGIPPVPPGQLPGNGRSTHADVDDMRALNHPRPADYVRLHAHLDGTRAGWPDRSRVSALAGRTARRQAARHSGRCEDAEGSGGDAHPLSIPLPHSRTRPSAGQGKSHLEVPGGVSPDAAVAMAWRT